MDCLATDTLGFSLRLRARRGACQRVEVIYACNKYEWDRNRHRMDMERIAQDSEFDYYRCEIHGSDNRLAYIFAAHAGDEIWYYSEEGLSLAFDNNYAYFNFFQYCFVHACDVFSPLPWADTACVYQIFPERFRNGLGDKPYINTPWYAEPTPFSFFGGDLPGITEKLEELEALGVNCLYLTPVFTSPSNHKYDIVDYWEVDPAFGGKPALKELIARAHARGIRVVLDGVFNHCSSQNALFQDVVKKGRQSPYYDWFLIDGDFPDERKGNYSMFAAVRYMPRLNTGHPEVIDYFCRVASYWIREMDADGWRLDVCDEISDCFLRSLRRAVKGAKPDALLLGEIWHEPAHWLGGDMLDGVMNYALTKACLDYMALETLSAQGFCDRLLRSLWRCPEPAARMALNLVGSHDTDRFLSRVRGSKGLLKMGYAAVFFMPGMACVYYGDEVGLSGGYDPGCRKGYPWEEGRQDKALRAFIQALYGLKKQPALSVGAFNAFVENGMAVLERSSPGQTARLYMNKTGGEKQSAWGVAVPRNECRVLVRTGAEGFAVLPEA